jgi:hypothetical protein
MEDFDRYVIKVYVEDLLIGYVKKLGRIKDGKRSFSITKKNKLCDILSKYYCM